MDIPPNTIVWIKPLKQFKEDPQSPVGLLKFPIEPQRESGSEAPPPVPFPAQPAIHLHTSEDAGFYYCLVGDLTRPKFKGVIVALPIQDWELKIAVPEDIRTLWKRIQAYTDKPFASFADYLGFEKHEKPSPKPF